MRVIIAVCVMLCMVVPCFAEHVYPDGTMGCLVKDCPICEQHNGKQTAFSKTGEDDILAEMELLKQSVQREARMYKYCAYGLSGIVMLAGLNMFCTSDTKASAFIGEIVFGYGCYCAFKVYEW